jgi:hypothetical protein
MQAENAGEIPLFLYRHFVPLGTDFSYFIHNFRLF